MLFVAILTAVFVVYLLQAALYRNHAFNKLKYTVTLNTDEVFEGEDIFMFEEITNDKGLPLPHIRVDTELPEGLKFHLFTLDKKNTMSDYRKKNIQSIFVMHGHEKIKRRWRISAEKRGLYYLGNVLLVSNDIFGSNSISKRITLEPTYKNRIIVFPQPINLEEHFTSSYEFAGERIVQRSILSDPLKICGSREYSTFDPMNKINWKSSAHNAKLMVNIEEYTEKHMFNLVMNMQSRDYEQNSEIPSSTDCIEFNISVCASIFDMIANENIPVRFYANTFGDNTDSEIDESEKFLVTNPFHGRGDLKDALTMLASLEMKISCRFENLLDQIINFPEYYANGGNIILVSSYINESMIDFHYIMKKQNIRVVYYLTSLQKSVDTIPDDIEFYYKTFK